MLDILTLRQVPIFSQLPESRLQWLLEEGTEVVLQPGEIHRNQGDLANHVFVLLEGEIRITQKNDNQELLLAIYKPRTLYGELPVLMGEKYFWATGRAATESRILEIPNQAFWELLSSCTCVMKDILRTMAQRLQEVQLMSQHREKLVALGTLAAGLAHELNNPASAGVRAVGQLREAVEVLRPLTLKLNQQEMTSTQKLFLADLQQSVMPLATNPAGSTQWYEDGIADAKTALQLDPLTQSDREDEITAWLETYRIENAWRLSPNLVAAGLDISWLENVVAKVGELFLGNVVSWIDISLQEVRLLEEIENSMTRISTLVQAVKDYSYMDKLPQQEIDIHDGLESTLTILNNKLKQGNITVNRDYGCNLPMLSAYGSELNQVWTNLIDNAIDAVNEGVGNGVKGEREGENENNISSLSSPTPYSLLPTPCITIRTNCEDDFLLVEIGDNGLGIPKHALEHLFEPFFTTKGVGKGTGLGLHIVYRIVVGQHQGDVRVVSQPGETRFQIRLPLKVGIKN
jgi:signal transduction histidine kinase